MNYTMSWCTVLTIVALYLFSFHRSPWACPGVVYGAKLGLSAC
jgi:hypothetical protein